MRHTRTLSILLRRLRAPALCLAAALAATLAPPSTGLAATPPAKRVTKGAAKGGAKARGKAMRTVAARPATGRRLPRPFERTRRATEPAVTLPTMPAIDITALAALASPGGASVAGAAGRLAPSAGIAAPASLVDAPKPFAALGMAAGSMLESLAAAARSQLGTRYVLGADRPGGALDCSSFTRFAMEAIGIRLPRTAAQQARVGVPVPRDRDRLRPGDLLTFGNRRTVSHVGIYLGGDRFIHASVTSGRVIETTFAKNTRLFRQWLGARRVLADADGLAAGPVGGAGGG